MKVVPFKGNILSVNELAKAFGGVKAVNEASFNVREGSITGLIGPNGAGKSTVVNLISGSLHPDGGTVSLSGTDITKSPSYKVAKAGLIRTFQISRQLQKLTVLENMLLAPQNQHGETSWAALFSRKKINQQEAQHAERALDLLEEFSLYDLRDEYSGNLSGGQMKLLDLARAMMVHPKILLLDEPMAGVNPTLARKLQEKIVKMNKDGVTILMIEHNLGVVEAICDHVVVMAEGKVLAEGRMDTLRDNEEVVAAYLGG